MKDGVRGEELHKYAREIRNYIPVSFSIHLVSCLALGIVQLVPR